MMMISQKYKWNGLFVQSTKNNIANNSKKITVIN